jgi:acyl-CoA thioesterase
MPNTSTPITPPDGSPLVDAVLHRLQPAPFWDHLGCALLAAEPGQATVRFPIRPEHGRSSNTGDGTAHGGAIASLVDMAASCALLTVLAENESRTTIDLAVHYLAPARGELTATATVRRRGGRTAVIDIEVNSGDESLVALGRTVFAILKDRG